MTLGPHSDPARSLSTGHAAHIRAAAPGGPRYDSTQSRSQRTSIDNGIWLCRDCGDLVDKDTSKHTVEQLERWRQDHENLLGEVRTKGYASSLRFLDRDGADAKAAKHLFDLMNDRRVFWSALNGESPKQVRTSLDAVRLQVVTIKGGLPPGSPVDQVLACFTKTIGTFFRQMAPWDMDAIPADSTNHQWVIFCDALAAMRKALGLQLAPLANLYNLSVSDELKSIFPKAVADR